MPDYKILALDLDGTLISDPGNFQAPVSRANLDALGDLRAAGTRIVICTGRNHGSVRSLLQRIGDPDLSRSDLILQNGALMLDGQNGDVISALHLPRDEARRALQVYRNLGMMVMLFDNHRRGGACLYDTEPRHGRLVRYMEMRHRENDDPAEIRMVDDLEQFLDLDPLAMGSIDTAAKGRSAAMAIGELGLAESEVHQLELVDRPGYTPGVFVELFHRRASKLNAFLDYCRSRGVDPARCAAIGDGSNDRELISELGLGIAMGNAATDLQQLADYVAPRYEQSGLATAIRETMLP